MGGRRTSRRSFLAGWAGRLAAGLVLGTGCEEWSRPPTLGVRQPVPSPSPGPLPIVLAVPPEPRIDLLPLQHLVESGHFREHQLAVRFIWGRGPYGALPELVAGRAELALLDVPTTARAAEQSVEPVGLWSLYTSDPSIVFTLERSGIRAAADLAGRKVGLVAANLAARDALLATLANAGLGRSDVEFVAAGAEAPAMLESGRVAALAGSRHLAPWFDRRSLPVVYLPRAGWEAVPGPSLVTRRPIVAERRTTIRRFSEALRSGIGGILAEPAGLRATAEAQFRPDYAARSAVRAQADAVLASLADAGETPGRPPPERWQATERYLRELGATEGRAELAKVFDGEALLRS